MNFFPDPYPGELLYSVFARYHHLSASTRVEYTMQEIFGAKRYSPVVDLPRHIRDLLKRIPFNNYNEQALINQHTLLPYYYPFLPDLNKEQVLGIMTSGKQGSTHTYFGYLAKSLQKKQFLKYCSDCIYEDIKKYGEPYWHVVHQAPGNFYCLQHDRVLSNGCEQCGYFFIPRPNQLINLDKCCPKCESDLSFQNQGWSLIVDKYKNDLIGISLDINYLLVNHSSWSNWTFINWQKLYFSKLHETNLCSENKQTRHQKLIFFFERYYNKKYLQLLNCSLDGSNWLKSSMKSNHAIHPLKHILLIRFLFGSLVDIQNCQPKNVEVPVFIKCTTYKRSTTSKKAIQPKVDWKLRDEQLFCLIEEANNKMRDNKDKPIRITLSKITEVIGYKNFKDNLNKLPRSSKLLEKVIENREEYQVRLLRWHFRNNQRNSTFPKTNILRKLSPRVRSDEKIYSRILKELSALQDAA